MAASFFTGYQKLKITVSDKEVIFYNNSELYKMAFFNYLAKSVKLEFGLNPASLIAQVVKN